MASQDTTRPAGRRKGKRPLKTAVVDCLSCGGMLLEQELLDEMGHWAVPPEKSLPLDYENDRFFFACPSCGAKNFIAPATNQYGVPQIQIDRFAPA